MWALLLALSGPARAAACCGPTGGDLPATLRRCERWGAALVGAAALEEGRWTSEGAWVPTSERWTQGTLTLGLAARPVPWLTVGAGLPAVGTRKVAGELVSSGLGPGDATLSARIEPWDPALVKAAPTLTLGLVGPTGRSAEESADPLQADITGQGHLLGVAGIGVERAAGAWPWHAGARVQSGAQGAESRLDLSAGVSHHPAGLWIAGGSLTGALGLSEPTRRVGADVQVIRALPPSARAWVSLGSEVPLSGLGRNLHGEARISAGVLLTR